MVLPAANVIRLRALLSDQLSGSRLHFGTRPAHPLPFWATGLSLLDEPLQGGLPKGALTEIVGAVPGSGAATLLHDLLRRAAAENQIIAVIDGADSLDVTQIDEGVLGRMLWVRARSAAAALKAADFILRDGNFSLVLLDLKFNPEKELRQIPATTWYRFQRIVEETAVTGVVFTPRPMVAARKARVTLQSRFSLDTLEQDREETLQKLKLEIQQARPLLDSIRQKNVA